MILPGSYANGFAPRDGQPLYPELWRGCVGAWAPCLGPTGLTLRDWSGLTLNGTLTNMVPGDDWVVNGGRYSLDFDQNADIVSSSSAIPAMATIGTVAAWVNFRTLNASTHAVMYVPNGGSQTLINQFGTSVLWYWGSGSPQVSAGTLSTGKWTHLCMTSDGTTVRAYVNGIQVGTGTSPSSQPSAIAYLGGWPGQTARTVDGQLDDFRIYGRALSVQEIRLLSLRRGIAYEIAPRRRSSVQVSAAFNRRRRLLIGASS